MRPSHATKSRLEPAERAELRERELPSCREEATVPMHFDTTCWTIIRGAAAGERGDRDDVARRYGPLVRSYYQRRWGTARLQNEVEDATQEVFLELFRAGGALERFDEGQATSFRAYLYAVIRNVARRFEERLRVDRRVVAAGSGIDALPGDEQRLSAAYDRLWVQTLVRQALELHRRRARAQDDDARERLRLLEARVLEGKPIRDVARDWEADPARLHKVYARARREFRDVLLEVVSFHIGGTPGEVERELRMLTSSLRAE